MTHKRITVTGGYASGFNKLFLAALFAFASFAQQAFAEPIHDAAEAGDLAAVAAFIEDGVDVNLLSTDEPTEGWTVLHVAARDGHDNVVEYLLTVLGVMVDYAGDDGWTPLLLAVVNEKVDTIRLLCAQNEINVNAKIAEDDPYENCTAILMAVFKHNLKIVQVLLQSHLLHQYDFAVLKEALDSVCDGLQSRFLVRASKATYQAMFDIIYPIVEVLSDPYKAERIAGASSLDTYAVTFREPSVELYSGDEKTVVSGFFF